MYHLIFIIALLILATFPISNSFSCIPENQRIRTFLTATSSLSIASKYFQLEEDEDKDVSTTEIYIVDDGTVELFDTDGPLPISAHGTWCQNGETFEMTVRRVFLAGKEHTDVGQFQYEVIRKMTGQLTRVGGLASVQGGIYIQVSFF